MEWNGMYLSKGKEWKRMEWNEIRLHLEGGNGMERNKNNNFRIFFPSLVWEF